MGPTPITSTSGHKYYISFLDGFSRYTCAYTSKYKDEAITASTHFKQMVEKQFDMKIKIRQSDWGGEFRSSKPLLDWSGIIFRHPCPHTSAQNGKVERKHRHSVEMGLTLMAQAKMPLYYW